MCCIDRLRPPLKADVHDRARTTEIRQRRHSDNTRIPATHGGVWLSCRHMLGCSPTNGRAPPFRSAVGIDMTPRTKIVVFAVTLVSLTPFCVASAQAPAVVGAAMEIPGVVKGGSPIQRILQGYKGLDDPTGLRDGTLVFSEPDARRLHRLNTQTN